MPTTTDGDYPITYTTPIAQGDTESLQVDGSALPPFAQITLDDGGVGGLWTDNNDNTSTGSITSSTGGSQVTWTWQPPANYHGTATISGSNDQGATDFTPFQIAVQAAGGGGGLPPQRTNLGIGLGI